MSEEDAAQTPEVPETPEVPAAVAPAPAPAPAGMSPNTLGMLTHLSSLSGFIGVPFGTILGPLVFWLIKKDELPFIDRCGKEALNFGISLYIYLAVSAILCLVVVGVLGLIVFGLMGIICPIIGAVKANNGEEYQYPMTIRFIT